MLKKLVIAAALFLALIVGSVVFMGATSKQVQYSTEVVIQRPIQDAWRVFADETRATEWIQGLESMEIVSGEPLTVGTRTELVFNENGRRMVVTETVTECEIPRRFAFDMEAPGATGHCDISFEPKGANATLMKSTTTMRGSNILWRALMRLAKGTMAERTGQDFERLKRVVEATPAGA